MRLRAIAGLLASCALLWPASSHAEAPSTGRFWGYLAVNLPVRDGLSLTLLPGLRTELYRSDAPSRGRYMEELFVGPNLSGQFGRMSARLSLWYYGMWIHAPGRSEAAVRHSLEVVPTLTVHAGPLALTSRTIFHNTLRATYYPTEALRSGYGLVLRELVQLRWQSPVALGVVVGEEPFWGLREDAAAPPSMLGFWPSGLRLNRLYAGVDFPVGAGLHACPQYVIEHAFGIDGKVSEVGHYLFLTLTASPLAWLPR